MDIELGVGEQLAGGAQPPVLALQFDRDLGIQRHLTPPASVYAREDRPPSGSLLAMSSGSRVLSAFRAASELV